MLLLCIFSSCNLAVAFTGVLKYSAIQIELLEFNGIFIAEKFVNQKEATLECFSFVR
jgi:hypothetical protein